MKYGDTKEECPHFITPEFYSITVLWPESLDIFVSYLFGSFPLFVKRKSLSCYLYTGYNV